MDKKIVLLSLIVNFYCCSFLEAQRLERFGADEGKREMNGAVRRIAYTTIRSYYGFIVPDSTAEARTKIHYLYFMLSDTTAELGVRMLSPVPPLNSPGKGDFITELYYEHEQERNLFFDNMIAIEYALGATADMNVETNSWFKIGENDDSNELIPQPNGKRVNALLRLKNEEKKILLPGLYRIAMRAAKKDFPKGGYIIEVGTTKEFFDLKLAATPAELLN